MANEPVHSSKEETTHDHAYLHAHGIAHSHNHVHANQKAVVNRLARAIGHLEKVKRMVEEGYDCAEVLVQLGRRSFRSGQCRQGNFTGPYASLYGRRRGGRRFGRH